MCLIEHGAKGKAKSIGSNNKGFGFEVVPFNHKCFKTHPCLVTTPSVSGMKGHEINMFDTSPLFVWYLGQINKPNECGNELVKFGLQM